MQHMHPIAIAFMAGLLLTSMIRRIAPRMGLVDRPDGHRKLHTSPVPLGGGIAVLLASVFAVLFTLFIDAPGAESIRRQPHYTLGLLGAATMICFVGLIDDRLAIRGRQKLFAQVIAVFLVVQSGMVIEKLEMFGWTISLGLLAAPFTIVWLLGAINSLNLIDGVDGLAGTVAAILSITIAALAGMTGQIADAIFAWALAGGVLGFLAWNLPPARIYLGDAGSMLVGLVLGVLAIRSSLKGPATVAMAAPTAIWAVLMFDVLMAVTRRKLTGQSIYATDRAHLHHMLQKRGFSPIGIVAAVGGLCSICAAGALASVAWKSELMAFGSSLAVLAMLVATGHFGRSECRLLLTRLTRFIASLFRRPRHTPDTGPPICSRFHGDREWEQLWDSLVSFANQFDVCALQLNVSSPSIGEEYHAVWKRKAPPPASQQWRTEIPLMCRSLCVGRLVLTGKVPDESVVAWLSELTDGLAPFEDQMTALLGAESVSPGVAQKRKKTVLSMPGGFTHLTPELVRTIASDR